MTSLALAAAIAPPAFLVRLTEPWAALYGDSAIVSTIVVYAHIAALMVAGGLAVALDRGTLRAARGAGRDAHLVALAASHGVVIGGLVASVVSGVLLFAADLEAYFASPIFVTKLALVGLLLANGYVMTRVEASLRGAGAATDAGWKRLALTARASLFLWFATAFVGVALVNA